MGVSPMSPEYQTPTHITMTTINPISPAEPHAPSATHIVSFRTLLTVFLTLVFATILTVSVTYIDLGSLNIWIALAIALAKAALVALYFMHLRWDSPFYGIILIVALMFVILFIGIAIMDTTQNLPIIETAAAAAP